MKKGIIFDLDGTLWDASQQVTRSWNMALATIEDFNLRIDQNDMMRFMGNLLFDIGVTHADTIQIPTIRVLSFFFFLGHISFCTYILIIFCRIFRFGIFLFRKVSSPNFIQFSSVLPTFFLTLCLYSFRNKYKTHKTNYN